MSDEFRPPPRSWAVKFGAAFRGVAQGIVGQNSFWVHVPAAVAVVAAAAWLRVSVVEWAVLVLCIGTVITAELFNSALEVLAKAIDRRENHNIAVALDVASGAVLSCAISAACAGGAILLARLL